MHLIDNYDRGLPKGLVAWLYAGCFIVFAMVVIGGITRLTGSGLSITEWKIVTGTIPPLSHQGWMEEFARYQKTPQFLKINADFNLTDFQHIYWWEYLHRLVGRLLGIVFIGGFVWLYIRNQISKTLMPKLLVMFLLGAWQGFLGWYMVMSGLVEKTSVSHYRLAIHLINAFFTFGYIFWVAQNLRFKFNYTINTAAAVVKKLSVTIMVLLALQIIYGAFVAGTHAGQIYNTWPKMNGEWIADTIPMAWHKMGLLSLVEALATIQFIHRTVAFILFCLIAYLWVKRKNAVWKLNAQQIFAINVLMLAVMVQFTLGVFTLLYHVPISMGVIHQAGAFFLFASLVHLLNRLYAKNKERKSSL